MKALIAASTLAVASLAFAADGVSVKPAEITETRQVKIIKDNVFGGASPGLEIKLQVEGDIAKTATQYGKVKITDATDDAGTDLKAKPKDSFLGSDDDFQDISRFGRDKADKAFNMSLHLGLPARSAKKIKQVKGEFQIIGGGEEKIVEIKNIPSQRGKAIEDPALKAAGLEMKFASKADDKTSVPMELNGEKANLKDVEVLDASGKNIKNGSMSSSFGGKSEVSYSLEKPLDDKMVMKIHLLMGQKATTVPFELKDLDLP